MDEKTTNPLPASVLDSTPVAPPTNDKMVLGVEIDILIRFLILFRDHYKKCEKATFFLENRTRIANVPGIANQRDALSHLSSALQPGTTRDQQWEQYVNAEEHFRRAIFEPYELAIKRRTFELIVPYDKFKDLVAPVRDRYQVLATAPTIEEVDAKIQQIADWRDAARGAKGENAWNETWEKGVEDCLDAFNLADNLFRELDKYCILYDQALKDEEREKELISLREEVARLRKEDPVSDADGNPASMKSA